MRGSFERPGRFSVFLAFVLAVAAVSPAAAQEDAVQLVVDERGNEARYFVREQLLNLDFPNDAIGVTTGVAGGIVLAADGSVVPARSRIVIDLRGLKSDRERRDGYLQRNTLKTDSFPTATFVPTALHGAAWPLADSTEVAFRLAGDMTVRGNTRPVTWNVHATRTGDVLTGRATLRAKFADFGLEVPRVRSVISIEDDIRLAYDFRFRIEAAPPVSP